MLAFSRVVVLGMLTFNELSIRQRCLILNLDEFINSNHNVFVIAELGINHSGNILVAQNLILDAKLCGAQAIKFQYRNLDKMYLGFNQEINDEIIKIETQKNYLTAEEILTLVRYGHDLNLAVGISFFNEDDLVDFGGSINLFDFFKVPSVELTNLPLITKLMSFQKMVFISVGCHFEFEIEKVFSKLPIGGWMPMHCVSNYPTTESNSNLGYITYLKEKWNTNVGYSSHDQSWEMIVGAIALGAKVIERHITSNKNDLGLDHSSSSSLEEFHRICKIASNSTHIFSGNTERSPNQGELLNLQNLGRSFYVNKQKNIGEYIQKDDLVYRSPRTGLSFFDLDTIINKPLKINVKKNQPLIRSHFTGEVKLANEVIEFARNHKLSLPVRLHDYKTIKKIFPIGKYEFHLSYSDLDSDHEYNFGDYEDEFSFHLPDYINSTSLLNPFSPDQSQATRSYEILDSVADLATEYQSITGRETLVVGSFSDLNSSNKFDFYERHVKMLEKYERRGVKICLQWLPPKAWYFGGSVEINVLNNLTDLGNIKNLNVPICLDTSHLILGSNYFGFNSIELANSILPWIVHSHISDASGFDGEGLDFGVEGDKNMDLIFKILNLDVIKVIEVWQGHLNNYEGFRKALISLKEKYEK